jgi:hypothetical protein
MRRMRSGPDCGLSSILQGRASIAPRAIARTERFKQVSRSGIASPLELSVPDTQRLLHLRARRDEISDLLVDGVEHSRRRPTHVAAWLSARLTNPQKRSDLAQ